MLRSTVERVVLAGATSALVCVLVILLISCGEKSQVYTPAENSSGEEVSKVEPDAPETGDAERGGSGGGIGPGKGGGGGSPLGGGGGVAGPMGEPQSLTDWTQTSINPWGPVALSLQVEVGPGEFVNVNQLVSPDPFTSTYQLENGDILVTNLALEVALAPGYVEPEWPTVVWQAPNGENYLVYDGDILVTFVASATQQDIEQFIADHNLYVIFSWFEPPEDPGDGNSTAWFQFEYDQTEFPTMDAAIAYFSAHPLVNKASPDVIDDYAVDWNGITADDPIYTGWFEYPPENTEHPPQCRYVNVLGVDSIPLVRRGPGWIGAPWPFSNQVIAVMDQGVYRAHYDLGAWCSIGGGGELLYCGKTTWVGVDLEKDKITIGYGLGEPEAWDNDRGGLVTHGTWVTGIITAVTGNGVGGASLAPSAAVLPLRLKVVNERYFVSSSIPKAIRALRFEFKHGNWYDYVRVVNMSFSGSGISGFEEELNDDLRINDRLYIASAGNEAEVKITYPAGYQKVLGVSGLWTDADGTEWLTTWTPPGYEEPSGSNYRNDGFYTYPVSGIYGFMDFRIEEPWYSGHFSTVTPGNSPLPYGIDGDVLNGDGIIDDYQYYWGTSACAPQVSALAFHLYSHRMYTTYEYVRQRIISTRDDSTARASIAGVVDYEEALDGW